MRRILLFLLFCHVLCGVAAQSVHAYPMAAADRGRMERAIQEYNKKHYRKSNDQLLQLSKLYPNNPDIYFYLGLNAVKRDFNATGIRRNFTRVIQLAPDYPDAVAHYYMGIIHYTDNQFDQAVDQFNQYFTLADPAPWNLEELKQAVDAEDPRSVAAYWVFAANPLVTLSLVLYFLPPAVFTNHPRTL